MAKIAAKKNLYVLAFPALATVLVEAANEEEAIEKAAKISGEVLGKSPGIISVVGAPKVTTVPTGAAKASKVKDEDAEETEEEEEAEEEEEEEETEEEEEEEETEEEEEEEKPKKSVKKDDKSDGGGKKKIIIKKKG